MLKIHNVAACLGHHHVNSSCQNQQMQLFSHSNSVPTSPDILEMTSISLMSRNIILKPSCLHAAAESDPPWSSAAAICVQQQQTHLHRVLCQLATHPPASYPLPSTGESPGDPLLLLLLLLLLHLVCRLETCHPPATRPMFEN